MRCRTALTTAAAVLVLALVTRGPAAAEDRSLATGTWEGWLNLGWTVRYDESVGGGWVFYNGGGPLLLESVGGNLTGDLQFSADSIVVPGPDSPFGPQTGRLDATARIGGGDGSIGLRQLTGTVSVAGMGIGFGPTTGTMTIDRVGCMVASGEIVYPPEGLGQIDAVGTFRNLNSRWTAVMTSGIDLDEERRIVESLATRVETMANALRVDGTPVDRRELLRLIGEAERRIAGLSAEAQCGTDWATPLTGSLLSLLDAAVARPEVVTPLELEFMIGAAVRSGGLPTPTGNLERSLAVVLERQLEAAVTAADRASIDAVFMAAVALGDRDLANRALTARGGL